MPAIQLNTTVVLSSVLFQQRAEPGKLVILYSNRKQPIETALPDESVLATEYAFDYSKSYRTSVKDKDNNMEALDFVHVLHKLILPAFTKATPANEDGADLPFKLGYTVLHKTKTEVVLGKIGKHLSIKHSLLLQKPRKDALQSNVVLSTAVQFHTPLGPLFFTILKPFLESLAPRLLKKAILRYA